MADCGCRMSPLFQEDTMKKTAKKLLLHRETLRLLGDKSLGQPQGGINTLQKTLPTAPTALVCTATCPC